MVLLRTLSLSTAVVQLRDGHRAGPWPLLSRFAARAGLVTWRQTFARQRHCGRAV